MATTQRLYRLTQTTLTRIHPTPSNPLPTTAPHPLINLETLSSFAARVLLHEHETVLVPSSDTSPKLTSEQVLKKCNVPEWEAKLSGRKPHLNDDRQETGDQEPQQQQRQETPPVPTSRAGVIFVSTTSSGVISEAGATDQDNIDRDKKPGTDTTTTAFINEATTIDGEAEKITSFLFARYEPTIPELQARLKTDLLPPPIPNQFASAIEDPDSLTSVPSRIQKLIDDRGGVTRVWLCGTDPAYRRGHLMSNSLQLLEQEVLSWETKEKDERVSGVVTAHTHPLRFPGMVQFLIKNGFKGGDRIKASEDKVFFWKELK